MSDYTGKSILDDAGPVPVAPRAAPPLPDRSLLIDVEGGGQFAVEHGEDPESAPIEHRFGERFVLFDDGNRVRADKIVRYRVVTRAEAAEEIARAPEAVPVVIAGAQVAQQPTPTSLDDLPYSMWPLAALVEEEKLLTAKCNPQGGTENASSDLLEVRAEIAKKRVAP